MLKPGAAKQRLQTGRSDGSQRKPRVAPYHHGSLRKALLDAAERILEESGIQGLTLRAAAREAGVSHTAPKNHFGDLSGLLSELAARGSSAGNHDGFKYPRARLAGAANGDNRTRIRRFCSCPSRYVPADVSQRTPRHEPTRTPRRRAGRGARLGRCRRGTARRRGWAALTLQQAAGIAGAWSLVHGFAMLLLDGRLKPIVARMPIGR